MLNHEDLQSVERLQAVYHRISAEVSKVIVGQHSVVDELLLALFAQGHCLLVGVPGLAKTLMIRTLAQTLDLGFRRIQFTPDLMPADVTGTEVIQEDRSSGNRELRFMAGPIFANIVLADEVNRTPPKTQAALLEAMQERQVTINGICRKLPSPFFVLATQNPIEHEGTYPLPEAQLDRFMLNVLIDYPSEDDELQIVQRTTVDGGEEAEPVLSANEVVDLGKVVRRIPIADHVARFALRFARMTRRDTLDAPEIVKEFVMWGAGPRASQYLVLAAKAKAAMAGRHYVSHSDVIAVIRPVLRHRIKTNFDADAEGMTPDHIIEQLIALNPIVGDESGGRKRDQASEIFRSADSR